MRARSTRPVNSWRNLRADTPLSEPTRRDNATLGVHQQVDVVGLAVELAQLQPEVGPHLVHDLLASGEHGVVEHTPAVPRCEDQVCVEVIDDASSPAYVGVWFPSR